ncbi:MAG: hypothetical protein RLZZ71_1437 [Bacteroidota bacterium]|jgi:hypothetical protein
MKNIIALFILLIFNSINVICQIWKEPIDTLPYIDRFAKSSRLTLDQIGVEFYSATQYSDKDSILSFDYYGFDRNGYLTKRFSAKSPNEVADTIKYYYLNGTVQGPGYKREHMFNEKKQLTEIRNTKNDSTWLTRYKYMDNLLIEIRYSNQTWTSFQYDQNASLLRKEIFQNGILKEYFVYEHPSKSVLVYQHCILDDSGSPYLPCEITEGYYDDERRLVKVISKYDLDSNNVFVTEFQFDKKGNVTKITDNALNDQDLDSETIYFRNEKGLVMKIENYKGGKLYNYFKFDYVHY